MKKIYRLLFCTPISQESRLHRPVKPTQGRFLVIKLAGHDSALAPGPAVSPAGHDSAKAARRGVRQADHDSNVSAIVQGVQIRDGQIMTAVIAGREALPDMPPAQDRAQKLVRQVETGRAG
jgi:hypothetical protein